MDKMRELKEELKKINAGRKFLEEAEPEKQTDKLIEFATEQCEIFPEGSEMGKYLRETLKMLQASPCEDSISRKALLERINNAEENFKCDNIESISSKAHSDIGAITNGEVETPDEANEVIDILRELRRLIRKYEGMVEE